MTERARRYLYLAACWRLRTISMNKCQMQQLITVIRVCDGILLHPLIFDHDISSECKPVFPHVVLSCIFSWTSFYTQHKSIKLRVAPAIYWHPLLNYSFMAYRQIAKVLYIFISTWIHKLQMTYFKSMLYHWIIYLSFISAYKLFVNDKFNIDQRVIIDF